MAIYSHSRLASYEQCPLKYKFAYVDGIKRKKDHVESFMGSRFHEVMECLYAHVPDRAPGLGELLSLFNISWDKLWHDGVIIHNKERTAEDYRTIGLRAISDYYNRYAPFTSGRVLGLERELVVNLDQTGSHQLRCIIDRLMRCADGAFEIHDYKTSGSLPAQAKLDRDRQLALYEIAVRDAWPRVEKVELVWHYVVFDMEMRSRRTPAELSELSQQIIRLIDEIDSAREFPARESELCSWCDFQEICPLFAHLFQVKQLPLEQYAEEEGVGLVNHFASLEAEKHELNERIRKIEAEEERLKALAVARSDALGVRRLYGDTHLLTLKEDIKVIYPKKGELARAEFEKSMKDLGIWDSVLDVSWNLLKSMAEKKGWGVAGALPSELAQFIHVDKLRQVRLSKRKDLHEDVGD